jgi:flagellar hook-length control protein FliK
VAGTPAALTGWPATPQAGTAPVAGPGQAAANGAAGAQALGAGALPGATGSVRVTPTTSTESALPTRQESPLAQVDGTIRFLVKNQDQSAELQLHPESLGRLQIKLKVEGTVVHAKVWASEASTVPLLNDQKALLEASLKNQGLSLGSFDLQHGRREDQAPMPAQESAPATVGAVAGAARGAAETAALAEAVPTHNGRIEIVA